MTERKPHKWAEVIKLAADGENVQASMTLNPPKWNDIDEDQFFTLLADKSVSWQFRIKPSPPPLKVEDVPLNFPCKLKDGREITPVIKLNLNYISDGEINYFIADVDPKSIIPTREVWLCLYGKGEIWTVEDSEALAHSAAIKGNGRFVYGPIRVPTKPLPTHP